MAKASKTPLSKLLRRISQIAFAGYVLVAAVRHGLAEGTAPSTDALCPFGGVETLWRWITTGYLVQKTHTSNLVLALALGISVVLVGGAFCGWICPFGALQELTKALRRLLHLPELHVPDRMDRILRYGRYVVLFGILYATATSLKLWFADFDPYRTIFSLGWIFEFNWAEHWPAYVISLAIVLASIFIPRVWCRYLCPLGGLISVFQKISLFRIRRDDAVCIHCNRCTKVCPANLPVAATRDTTSRCIGCLECLETCPKAGALDVAFILPLSEPTAKEKSI